MVDKKPDEADDGQATIVGGPISVPVEVDQAVAYGKGREVHWKRETDNDGGR